MIFTSPKAGSGVGRDQVPELVRLIEQAGGTVRISGDVDELKKHAQSAGNPIVVAAGGDGTLALAAQSIDADVPLVPMPMGTENLLARHFGHVARAANVLQTIRHGGSYRLDAGLANGRPFLIMATCGFDAEVVRGMHLTRRGHINRFSYARPILRALRRYTFPKLRIHIDDGQTVIPESCWCMIFNLPRYAANLKIETDAVGNDSLLDVIAFERGSVGVGLKYVAGIATGRHRRFRDVFRCRGATIEVTSDQRVPYQLDGDYAGKLPLKIETVPGRVHLLLPPESNIHPTTRE
jgi:diacylglycerol kinase family enzyme